MRQTTRPKTVLAVALLAAVIAFGASRLLAGPGAPAQETESAPGSAVQPAGTEETTLTEFLPSEELPAGSAVAFPTDI